MLHIDLMANGLRMKTAEYHPIGDARHVRLWPSNCTKLAIATLFTLFFGGNEFAPNTQIDGEPAQEYLQRLS